MQGFRINQRGLSTPAALGIVLVLIVLGVAGWLLFAPEDEPQSVSNQNIQPNNEEPVLNEESPPPPADGETVTVTYTNDGFSPSTITITQGDTVRFINDSNRGFHPASNDHPNHTIYPGFDANDEIDPGGSYSFTFDRVGTWGYHNHELEGHTGTVVVEAPAS